MNLRIIASLSSALSLQAFGQFQTPLDERWVLAEDKQKFLQSLTPGTDDYYFFHALHQQNSGQRAEFKKTMQQWVGNKKQRSNLPTRFAQLENRQVLLDYEAGEKGSDRELQKILNISKPEAFKRDAIASQLPSQLTDEQISDQAFERALNIQNAQRMVELSTQRKLEMLITEDKAWSKQERDRLLRQVTRADLPRITQRIEENFNDKLPLAFNQIACSQQLSHGQLKSIAKSIPNLLNDSYFVDLVIQSMQSKQQSEFTREPQLRLEWMRQLEAFTSSLPDSQNSLKAHVLYHQLRLAHEADSYPVDTFVRYLKLPRAGKYYPTPPQNTAYNIDLGVSYSQLSGCPPINSDEELVNRYLDKLLANSDNRKALSPFFKKQEFAQRVSRSQLLSGVDPEKISHQLSASAFENLRDAKEISIAASTRSAWSELDSVVLNVDLKNIDQLTVSIYALDSLRYMQETGKVIGDKLDLSSMIPTISRTIDTKKSPFTRHRSVLDLPELKGLGCWMVELHGNGQRATAILRKGELHYSTRDTGSGQEIFVSDYNGKPLKDVLAVVDGKKLLTDEKGTVTLPYSGFESKAAAYLHRASMNRENGITCEMKFDRKRATPSLSLTVLSHPEQWIADEEATFYYRPSLRINQHAGPLECLLSAEASLEARLTDGTKMQLARTAITISTNDYLPMSFQVPQNLAGLELHIEAKLKPIAGRDDSSLSIKKSLPLTASVESSHLAHGYFYQVDDQWMYQSLGRNGEAWANQKLRLNITHRHYVQPIRLDLATDAEGKIKLGSLPNMSAVRVIGDKTLAASSLDLLAADLPLHLGSSYSQSEAVSITLPNAPALQRLDYALISLDPGRENYFESMQLSESGKLSIKNLPIGKYSLSIRGYQPHTLEITDAKPFGAWATRKGEAYERSASQIPHITGASIFDGKLSIDIAHQSLLSRIHIIGSQFSAAGVAFQPSMPSPAPTNRQAFGFDPSLYQNGGTLSGEHQYILNRRAQGHKLGTMLERPAWHLNPWHATNAEAHENGALHAESDRFGRSSGFASGARSLRRANSQANISISAPITFLNNPAIILANLIPNQDGKVEVDLGKLNNLKRVDVILTQGDDSDSRQVSLPESALQTRDLRLANALNSKVKYVASETRAQLNAGSQAKITNILNAKWKAYTKLSDVFSYFHSHAPESQHRDALNDLSPILRWPQLTQDERVLLLSQSACHELHLFIKHRDPEWFAQQVAPQLTLKRHKSFMDHYLLDHDLTSYARFAQYKNLNTMEQALLAQRLQSDPMRAEMKARYLRKKPSNEANTATFAALLSQGFESSLDQYRPLMAGGTASYKRKLAQIVIPEVNFQNMSLEQVLDVLRSRAIELDSAEIDPARKGVNLFIGSSQSADTRAKRIPMLQLSNVPLQTALQQVADATGTRYRVTNGGVEFLAATDRVDLIAKKKDSFGNAPAQGNSRVSVLGARSKGLEAPAPALSQPTDDAFADEDRSSFRNQPIVDPDSLPHQTKSYAESYYYQREWSAGKQEIPVNQFWVDLAHWDGESDFLSPHFADCSNSRHEALVALAMMGLPFESEEIDVKIANNTMTVTAKQPMLLYYKDLHESAEVAKDSALLSSLRYFWSGDHFSTDANGKKSENAVTGDFKTQALYDAQLVITNPSGIEREIDILRQIPEGSIRLGDSESLTSIKTTIPPRGSWTHTVQFYFPKSGKFPHYPPQIHDEAKSVSSLTPQLLNVLDELAIKRSGSWAQLTSAGSDEEVLAALQTRALHTIDPSMLASRMENSAFYHAASKILRSRMIDAMSLAAFAIQHRDTLGVVDLLANPDTSGNLFGYYANSDLLRLTPQQAQMSGDTEWTPLINPRAFTLTDQNRITNAKVWNDYLGLLNQLVWKNELETAERLSLAYHLYLHDRNEEANQLVESLKREQTEAVMQFDYLTCYRHFLSGEATAASKIAEPWAVKAQEPWRQRFVNVVKQAAEIQAAETLTTDDSLLVRDRHWSASVLPGNVLRVEHQNMKGISVQVYPVDLEFLFSSTPFLQSSDSSYKALRPLQTLSLKLDPKQSFTELELPDNYQNGDRLLVINEGGKEWLQPLQSTKIKAVIQRNTGMLQATASDGKPLPRCYVKVYALDSEMQTHFYKDGHTDLRGMFDFISHNVHSPVSMQKYAIFISHPELGSMTTLMER